MIKSNIIILFFGILLGIVAFFSKGTAAIALLAIFTCFYILRYSPKEYAKTLMLIFIFALIIRVVVSVAQDYIALTIFPDATITEVLPSNPYPINDDYSNLIKEKTRTFFGQNDSDYSSARGYVFNAVAKGYDNKPTRLYADPGFIYGSNGYLYLVGLFYYLFDYSPIAVKFINCFLGALVVVWIFLLVVNFNRRAAVIASCLTAFFPSLIIWSTTNLKDTSLTLLNVLMVWSVVCFIIKHKKKFLFYLLSFLVLQNMITHKEYWLLIILSLALTSFAIYFINSKRKLVFVFLILLLFFAVPARFRDSLNTFLSNKISRMFVYHHGFIMTGGVNYEILDKKFYENSDLIFVMSPINAIKFSLRGFFHFLFEPLPIRASQSKMFLIVLPQTVVWYALLFFVPFGILYAFRYNWRAALFIMIYLLILSCGMAISSGNVGTLIRHRDYLTPLYFVFIALGIVEIYNNKKQLRRYKNENIL